MSSLYIHIPFCEKKCLYCSFVVAIGQRGRIDAYLDALSREAQIYRGRTVSSVYLGGGTPTFLNGGQLQRLIEIVRNNFRLAPECEFTVEANPEGLDAGKARLLKTFGVNRVSLGVQTLDDGYLKFLGRCHDRAGALKAFGHLREAGFENINVDLMYSFPQQTPDEIARDVEAIAALGSEHLSLYTLTVEPNSRFFAQKLQLHDHADQAQHYSLVVELLEKHGFAQYEVSNFTKSGRESKHNINYWTGGNYIGLGIGAHSHQDGKRFWNISRLLDYIERMKSGRPVIEGEEKLDAGSRLIETMLFGLRMNEGVDLAALEQRFGCSLPDSKRRLIEQLTTSGFFFQENNRLTATPKGRLVLDEISSRLI